MKEKKDNHRWWSDFADASFLRNWSYFVDVRKRVGEFLPAGLKNRALRGRNKLVQLRLSHCCIFDKTPDENMWGNGLLSPVVFALNFCLSIHVHSLLIEVKDVLSSWTRAGEQCASAARGRHPRVRTYLTKKHISRLFIG